MWSPCRLLIGLLIAAQFSCSAGDETVGPPVETSPAATHPQTRREVEAVLKAAGFAETKDMTWTQPKSTLGAANALAAKLGLTPLNDPFPAAQANARMTTYGGGVEIQAELTATTVAQDGANAAAPVTVTVQLVWTRLPTPYTLFQPPKKSTFHDWQKALLTGGCTTSNGHHYKLENSTPAKVEALVAVFPPAERKPVPCGPPNEMSWMVYGEGYSLLIQHRGEAGDEPNQVKNAISSLDVIVDPDFGDGIPPEAKDAPPPTRLSAEAMLRKLGFKEIAPGVFQADHVFGFTQGLAGRAVGEGKLTEKSRPAKDQDGDIVWMATNPALKAEVELRIHQYVVPHKPDSWAFDRMTVRFNPADLSPSAPNAPGGKPSPKP